tara:strand:+ start:6860 stop:8143 length:1284 start_codon:yes stop_codon:yes gene_type:complete
MPNTFDYPPDDRESPAGSNDLSALAMFYQRSLFREVVYPETFPAPLDTWYDKTLYGKIDRMQNTITLKNEKIKPVVTIQNRRIYAADFVVLAFESFVDHMNRASIDGRLNTNTDDELSNLKAAEGWSCPHKTYSQYVQSLYEGFIEFYVLTEHDKIDNFKTFIPAMKDFLKTSAKILPVTMTNALLTNMIKPSISGLSLKIANYDAGDDSNKYEKYISNPNFDFYRASAKKFGFIVNKNIPWVLTADLFSDAMLSFLGAMPGSTTKESFFTDYYDLACLSDIKNFKEMFVNFYNQYVEINPFSEKVIDRPDCPGKVTIQVEREFTTMSELDSLMTDFDWIDFYIDLREIESEGTTYKTNFIRRIARDKYEISTGEPLEDAVRYINTLYRKYLYRPNYLFTLLQPLTRGPGGGTIGTGGTSGGGGTSY